MTDTAALADIILPSTTQLEHFDVQGAWGHHYISVNHPAVAPLGEAASHGEILRRLSRGMGLTHPALFETDEQMASVALPSGVSLNKLKEAGWIKRSPTRPIPGAAAKLRGRPTALLGISARGGRQCLTATLREHMDVDAGFGREPR